MTHCLGIKVGFDSLNAISVCFAVKMEGVPHYMVSCLKSCVSHRASGVLMAGSPKCFTLIQVHMPQRSSIFPLLFVICVASFHIVLPEGSSYAISTTLHS